MRTVGISVCIQKYEIALLTSSPLTGRAKAQLAGWFCKSVNRRRMIACCGPLSGRLVKASISGDQPISPAYMRALSVPIIEMSVDVRT